MSLYEDLLLIAKTVSYFLMARKKKKYQRLPGKKKSFIIGYHTLWQGDDHLLSVYSRFGLEDYRRFYFTDIQSMIVHKTVSGKIQNLILGLFLPIFALMAFTLDGGLEIFGGIMAVSFLIILSINWLCGPTCVMHICTAVQNEKLPSLHRLKSAQKVMDRLKPLIEKVQGRLTPEVLNQNLLKGHTPGATSLSPSLSGQSVKPIRSESGIAHLLLFSLILLDGLLILLNAHFQMKTLTLLSTLTNMGIGISVVIALVKQRESNIPKALCNLTWIGLGFVCISFLLGSVFTMVLYFKNPGIMGNQWKLIELVAAMSFFENPFVASLNILSLGGTFCLGIPGLMLVDKHRKKLKGSAAKLTQSLPASPPLGNQ